APGDDAVARLDAELHVGEQRRPALLRLAAVHADRRARRRQAEPRQLLRTDLLGRDLGRLEPGQLGDQPRGAARLHRLGPRLPAGVAPRARDRDDAARALRRRVEVVEDQLEALGVARDEVRELLEAEALDRLGQHLEAVLGNLVERALGGLARARVGFDRRADRELPARRRCALLL